MTNTIQSSLFTEPTTLPHPAQLPHEIYLGLVGARFVCGWQSLRLGEWEGNLRPAFADVAEVRQELHRKQSLAFPGAATARMIAARQRVAVEDEE